MKYKTNQSTSIFIIIALAVISILSIIIPLNFMTEKIILISAKNNAEIILEALNGFRSIYTREIITKVKKSGMKVSHNFEEIDTIPLPISMTIELSDHISKNKNGGYSRIYSPYPFLGGNKKGLPDAFSKVAWKKLLKNPKQVISRVENINGAKSLRVLRGDILHKSCVGCHNTHPNSPKRNWREGDLRGILEVVRPLEPTIIATQSTVNITRLILIIIFCLIFYLYFKNWNKLRDANLSIRKGHEFITKIMDSLSEFIVVTRKDGSIIGANKSIKNLLGINTYDLFNHNFKSFCKEDLRGDYKNFHCYFIDVSGHEIPVSLTSTYLINKQQILYSAKNLEDNENLENQILQTSEREKQRIGQQLHDGIGQYLTGLSYTFKGLRLQNKTLNNKDYESIERVIQKIVIETRMLAQGIYPLIDKNLSLFQSLEELVLLFQETYSVKIKLNKNASFHLVNFRQEEVTNYYFIVQEALLNGIKHGASKYFHIFLYFRNGVFLLKVQDYGSGFIKEISSGLGVKIMKYRARHLGARLIIKTIPKGVSVTCIKKK